MREPEEIRRVPGRARSIQVSDQFRASRSRCDATPSPTHGAGRPRASGGGHVFAAVAAPWDYWKKGESLNGRSRSNWYTGV